jgi:hypothetical protein
LRFIRAYWGNLKSFNERHLNEILNIRKTSNLNEYVYVWGIDNYNYLYSLGFKCEYMGEFRYDYLKNSDIYMLPKLWAIRHGIIKFDEVVFLDWDCIQKMEIDDNFYNLLRSRGDIQMPLYTYPIKYKEIVFNEWKEIPNTEKQYIEKQFKCLLKFNYEWKDSFVTPNAGFIYCNSLTSINKLLKIIVENKDINIAIEEMGFLVYSKEYCKNISEYSLKFEPLVASAKENSHFNQSDLNKILPNKIIYFQHI